MMIFGEKSATCLSFQVIHRMQLLYQPIAALQAPKKIPAFQRLHSFFFQRNTADAMGLFLQKEICGMKF
jgi:hypothetical protein